MPSPVETTVQIESYQTLSTRASLSARRVRNALTLVALLLTSLGVCSTHASAEDDPLGAPPAEKALDEAAEVVGDKAKEVSKAVEAETQRAIDNALKKAKAAADEKRRTDDVIASPPPSISPTSVTPGSTATSSATADGEGTPVPRPSNPAGAATPASPSGSVKYRRVIQVRRRIDPRTGRVFHVRVPALVPVDTAVTDTAVTDTASGATTTGATATGHTAASNPANRGGLINPARMGGVTPPTGTSWVEVRVDGTRVLHRPGQPSVVVNAQNVPIGDGTSKAVTAKGDASSDASEGGFPDPDGEGASEASSSDGNSSVGGLAPYITPENAAEMIPDPREFGLPANEPRPSTSADLGTAPGLKKPRADKVTGDPAVDYGDSNVVGSGGFESVGGPGGDAPGGDVPDGDAPYGGDTSTSPSPDDADPMGPGGDPFDPDSGTDTVPDPASSPTGRSEPDAANEPHPIPDDGIWEDSRDSGSSTGPSSSDPILRGIDAPVTVPSSINTRVQQHVTLLRDRPVSSGVTAYPGSLMMRQPADVVLEPRRKACVVAFFDDTSRGSAAFAADVLPILVNYRDEIEFVAIDSGRDAKSSPAEQRVARRYQQSVPGLVVLPPDRDDVNMFSSRTSPDDIEQALEAAVRARPRTSSPVPKELPPQPRDPSREDPLPRDIGKPRIRPSDRLVGSELVKTARAHADELRRNAGDPDLVGYPRSLLRVSEPDITLERGQRPLVILFYDDSAKSSDKQAAEFLPMLVRRSDDVDLIVIDVSAKAKWNAVEKRIVRTYYMSFVPTTVVLTARRGPVRQWYHLIRARDLERAINEAARK